MAGSWTDWLWCYRRHGLLHLLLLRHGQLLLLLLVLHRPCLQH